MSYIETVAEATKQKQQQQQDATSEAQADLDRLQQQEKVSKKAGFALADPIYALGTRVNSTGVANARLVQSEWEDLPLLQDALSDFSNRIAQEQRRDVLFQAGDLEMTSEGRIIRRGSKLEGATLTEAAFSHLVGLLPERPNHAVSYLSGPFVDVSERAWKVNKLLQREANRDRELRVLFRFPQGDQSQVQIHCVGSDRYTPFGPGDLARSMQSLVSQVPSLREARAEVLYQGTGQTRIRAISVNDTRPEQWCAGEIFKAVFTVGTSDDKSSSTWASAEAWRNLCLNLICLDIGTQKLFTKRHVGDYDRLVQDLAKALTNGVKKQFLPFLALWSKGREQEFSQAQVQRVIEHIAQKDAFDAAKAADNSKWTPDRDVVGKPQMHIPGIHPTSLVDWIVEAYREEPEPTLTGVANAIARVPHTTADHKAPNLVQAICAETSASVLRADPETWAF